MVEMTPLMAELLDKALADDTPCLVGTASKDGRPQISPKGSVAVYDHQTLCFWERSGRGALARLKENPRVVVYYRNAARAKEMPFRGAALRFHGSARVVEDGPAREKAWELTVQAEKDRDPEKKGVAVLIAVDLIEELSGNVVMKAD
jgi:predicted pyridoxine 5'-phosphate oxidase superfamily flavin-nucleotide-binding protein